MKRPGCCGACGGDGVDPSAWESNGACWDCRGTGHAHLGPCGRWESFAVWCRRQELNALTFVLGWAWITALLAIMPGAEPWAVYIQAVPILLGIPAWVAMGKLGDRQMIREHERGARPVEVSRLEEDYRFVVARRETRRRRRA